MPMHESILIVDGSRETLELAQRVLSNERYDVHVARSAEEALELLERLRPHVVLTDMRLPGSVGATEMVARMRANRAMQGATVVMVTTDASEAERQTALASGYDDFIARPLTTAMLRELVARWVSRDIRGQLSPTGRSWLHRLFRPSRRWRSIRQIPTYKAGTMLPAADHFAPMSRQR